MRESPSTEVIHELQALGLHVVSYDPHIKENQHPTQTQNLHEAASEADLLLILTDHNEFKEMNPTSVMDAMHSKHILDTKNCMNREEWSKAGFAFYALGDSKNKPIE